MTEPIAISVSEVSKRYQIFETQRARLRHAFWPSSSEGLSEVWALRDVSFEVRKGDAVAIIGRNGSGKSTLLEIITGTLQPTSGSARVEGRIAALLELGSGFNPEYTGRENVFLNGLLLGLARAKVELCFDEIAGFADIGDVLDRPVKTYSSGMLVRLAFAVQVALEPDILIVDEALSVGDYFFQQKCFGRLRKMREDGLTLLFVSHDMGTVRDLCNEALYLNKGRNEFFGDSKLAIGAYLAQANSASDSPAAAPVVPVPCISYAQKQRIDEAIQGALWQRPLGVPAPDTQERLLAVVLRDHSGQAVSTVRMGEKILFHIYFRTLSQEKGHISLVIKNRFDQVVSNTGSYILGLEPFSTNGMAHGLFELEVGFALEAGLYSALIVFGLPAGTNQGETKDSTGWLGPIRVDWDYENERAPFLGMFGVPARGRFMSDRDL